MRVLNPTTNIVRVEQNVKFTKSLNFKEKKKLSNETQYKSSSNSSLAKLPKISTLPTTSVPLLSIKIIFANFSTNNLIIEAIYKLIYEKIQLIANKYL